jgi:copper homeostasis protein CutC
MGSVREALRRARVPVFVIVRPRGGDFLYSEAEFESLGVDRLLTSGQRATAIDGLAHLKQLGQLSNGRMIVRSRAE